MHHTAVAGDAAIWMVTPGAPSARSDPLAASPRAISAHERLDGRPTLTRRQRQVLHLLNQGLTYREVAGTLALAEKSVRHYASDAIARLEVDNIRRALYLARRAGLIADA